MLNGTLLKQTIRENWVLWAVLTAIQGILLAIMGATTNVQMSGIAYYNMLPEILSAVYVIVTGNKLLSAQVDKGTLAYVLSTPVKRLSVAVTQAFFFVGSLFLMFAVSAGSHMLSTQFLNKGLSSANAGIILKLNLGLFVLALSYAGICYLASCIFNLSKYTIAAGGGIVGVFILLPIVSMFGDKFKDLKNLSLSSLYDAPTIIAGTGSYVSHFIILALVGIITIAIGSQIFVKKDLPL